ncbi:MAG: tyrosine-protein phosphatase [Pseudomonadales bacterium]|nr:tyrosine-protein phosphatase [Pseudomonadales bacterium]
MTPDRIISIPGAVNLRDFGGYLGHQQHSIRRGRLFRSGAMDRLGGEGIAQFNALGIQTICDLRRPEEREQEPTPDGIRAKRVEIPMDPGSAIAMRAALADEDLNAQTRIDFMVAINHELATNHQDDYAQLFEALLQTEDGGFLVHCAAGKDRTGFAAALILHTLGVEASVILSDYLFTNMAIDLEGHVLPRMRRYYGDRPLPDLEAIMAIAGVRPEYLQAAYGAIAADFESVERYLEDALGLDQARRHRLGQRYLTA